MAPITAGDALRPRHPLRSAIGMLGLFSLVFGAILGAISAGQLWSEYRVSRWPRADGYIRSAVITRDVVGAQIGRYGSVSLDQQRRLHVEYTYTVDGMTHSGNTITFRRGASRNAASDGAKYSVGKLVTVHFNPDDTGSSVLETGPGPSEVVGMLAAAALLWLARWSVVKHARRRVGPNGEEQV